MGKKITFKSVFIKLIVDEDGRSMTVIGKNFESADDERLNL